MKLTDDELVRVAGGWHLYDPIHDSCPAGAIEMKWHLDHFLSDRKPRYGCPICGGHLREQKFWFRDTTRRLHNGFTCEKDDSHRWIWGDPI